MDARTEVVHYVVNGILSIWRYQVLHSFGKAVLYICG